MYVLTPFPTPDFFYILVHAHWYHATAIVSDSHCRQAIVSCCLSVFRHVPFLPNTPSYTWQLIVKPMNYSHGSRVRVLSWLCNEQFYSCPPGLIHWHWINNIISPVTVAELWRIWVHGFYGSARSCGITTIKQSKAKPCAHMWLSENVLVSIAKQTLLPWHSPWYWSYTPPNILLEHLWSHDL